MLAHRSNLFMDNLIVHGPVLILFYVCLFQHSIYNNQCFVQNKNGFKFRCLSNYNAELKALHRSILHGIYELQKLLN